MVPDASRHARAGVVIPIRAFAVGKARLSETLDDAPRAELAERMADRVLAAADPMPVVVAHADLPAVRSLAGVAVDASRPVAVVVPCHRDDGTPVLSVPIPSRFRFAYGPGSFRAHVAEARRVGLAVRVVRDPDLGFDVDLPADLAALRA